MFGFSVSIFQPKRKTFEDFWDEFESECSMAGLVSKVPISMKKILTACGYNHAWAFKDIDMEKITEMEAFVQSRHRKIADTFEEYKEIVPFEFLPGHRSLIFGIKEQILSIEQSKKPKLKAKEKNVGSNEDDLKANLRSQLFNFSSNISIETDWSDSIQSFEMEGIEDEIHVKCLVKCPICSALRVVRYDKKYWKLSNLTRHLRNHATTASKNANNIKNQQRVQKNPKKSMPSTSKTKNITVKAVGQHIDLRHKDGASGTDADPVDLENYNFIETGMDDIDIIIEDDFTSDSIIEYEKNDYSDYDSDDHIAE